MKNEEQIGEKGYRMERVIKDREVALWTEIGKHKAQLIKMLEDRDNALKVGLESRDKN